MGQVQLCQSSALLHVLTRGSVAQEYQPSMHGSEIPEGRDAGGGATALAAKLREGYIPA